MEHMEQNGHTNKYLGKNPFKYNIIYIYKWNKHQNQNATQKNK